jgi:hypothetical protein
MMGDEFDAGKYGAIVALQFGVANAVTEKTAEDLTTADASAVNTLVTMPKAGSVVGITVDASAEVTAGTVTFAAQKDGTEFAQSGFPNPGLSTTYTNKTYASIRPGVLTFSAGEAVGVSYTSSTDMEPTDSNDFSVLVLVQFDPN